MTDHVTQWLEAYPRWRAARYVPRSGSTDGGVQRVPGGAGRRCAACPPCCTRTLPPSNSPRLSNFPPSWRPTCRGSPRAAWVLPGGPAVAPLAAVAVPGHHPVAERRPAARLQRCHPRRGAELGRRQNTPNGLVRPHHPPVRGNARRAGLAGANGAQPDQPVRCRAGGVSSCRRSCWRPPTGACWRPGGCAASRRCGRPPKHDGMSLRGTKQPSPWKAGVASHKPLATTLIEIIRSRRWIGQIIRRKYHVRHFKNPQAFVEHRLAVPHAVGVRIPAGADHGRGGLRQRVHLHLQQQRLPKLFVPTGLVLRWAAR